MRPRLKPIAEAVKRALHEMRLKAMMEKEREQREEREATEK